MADESDEMRVRRRAVEQREWQEANTEAAKQQKVLDFWWGLELNPRAVEDDRRSRPDEHPERGEYNPIARFEREKCGW